MKKIKIEHMIICFFTFLIVLRYDFKLSYEEKTLINIEKEVTVETETDTEKNEYRTSNVLKLISKSDDLLTQYQPKIFDDMLFYDNKNNNNIKDNVENKNDNIESIKCDYIDKDTPLNNSFKAYMDYRTITDETSNQWSLQQQAYTDDVTGIRMIDNRYCIAVGSYYSVTVGTHIDLIMNNGCIIECILSDLKADEHTNIETHQYNPNGGIVEFIVDENIIIPLITGKYGNTGNVSNLSSLFEGEIKYIRVYKTHQN